MAWTTCTLVTTILTLVTGASRQMAGRASSSSRQMAGRASPPDLGCFACRSENVSGPGPVLGLIISGPDYWSWFQSWSYLVPIIGPVSSPVLILVPVPVLWLGC